MKKNVLLFVLLFAASAFCLIGVQAADAPDPTKMGTILGRTDVAGAPGMEAILVLREVPAGAESGFHTQSGSELVYILEGSVILEVKGKPVRNVKAGESFSTVKGEVHNVKNASTSEPTKALAFYIAKKGAKLEDLSIPEKQ